MSDTEQAETPSPTEKTRELFQPTFKPLDDESSKYLLTCILAESKELPAPPLEELGMLAAIIDKRIEVMELPIKFTPWALTAVMAFAYNPGSAVTLLIDCLDFCEGKEVTTQDLCSVIYPFGFYDEKSFEHIVDNIHKARKAKWSWVYAVTR